MALHASVRAVVEGRGMSVLLLFCNVAGLVDATTGAGGLDGRATEVSRRGDESRLTTLLVGAVVLAVAYYAYPVVVWYLNIRRAGRGVARLPGENGHWLLGNFDQVVYVVVLEVLTLF